MDEEIKTPNVEVETVSEQTDLSLLGLIYEADFFVQIIMLLLLLSSIWCWTIIINKSRLFRREKKISKLFQEYYDSNEVDDDTLLDFYNNNSQNEKNAQVNVFIKAMLEFNKIHTTSSHSVGKNHFSELVERVQLTLQIIVNREIEKLEQLRWLQNNIDIAVVKVEFDGIEINTPEDLEEWHNKNYQSKTY